MREADVELAVVGWAEDHGWMVRKVQWIGRVGAPDRVFMRNGVTYWMEFKAPGEKPRPSQVAEHRRFAAAGLKVHVIDRALDGIELLMGAPW